MRDTYTTAEVSFDGGTTFLPVTEGDGGVVQCSAGFNGHQLHHSHHQCLVQAGHAWFLGSNLLRILVFFVGPIGSKCRWVTTLVPAFRASWIRISRLLSQPFGSRGKPPCDAELNLIEQLAVHWGPDDQLAWVPIWLVGGMRPIRGWTFRPMLGGPTGSSLDDNGLEKQRPSSGQMSMGGLFPVLATRTGAPPGTPNDTDTQNIIALDPPPANSGDHRVDFVFLEVWKARVAPNPSTVNKAGCCLYLQVRKCRRRHVLCAR
jgi:hypothetical protein